MLLGKRFVRGYERAVIENLVDQAGEGQRMNRPVCHAKEFFFFSLKVMRSQRHILSKELMSYLFSKGHSREMLEDGLKKGKIKEERTVNRTFNTVGRIC